MAQFSEDLIQMDWSDWHALSCPRCWIEWGGRSGSCCPLLWDSNQALSSAHRGQSSLLLQMLVPISVITSVQTELEGLMHCGSLAQHDGLDESPLTICTACCCSDKILRQHMSSPSNMESATLGPFASRVVESWVTSRLNEERHLWAQRPESLGPCRSWPEGGI